MPDADGQLAPDAKGAALREALGRLGSAVVAFLAGWIRPFSCASPMMFWATMQSR